VKASVSTELGELPLDWKVYRLDSLFIVQQGKQVSKANRIGNNQRPFLRTKNVFWGSLDLSDLDQMHFSEADQVRLALRPDDLLVCEGGDIGRTAMWSGELPHCYYQNHLHRVRVRDTAAADPQFALYWLWYAFEIGKVYFGRGNVTTIPNLSQSKLCELPLPVPPILEQRRIAAVLSLVQHAIQQQERLSTKTAELKKALLDQLFTQGLNAEPRKETEIGPVPESWDVQPLGSLLREPLRNGHSAKATTEATGVRTLTLTAVTQRNFGPMNTKLTVADRERVKDLWLKSGDILIERANTPEYVGLAALYEGPDDYAIYPDLMIRVRVDESRVLPYFLAHFLVTRPCRTYFQTNLHSTAGNFPKIDQGTVEKTLIPLPDLGEQHKIVGALRGAQRKLDVHAAKVAALSDLLRTLMYLLMTAQIRVHDLDLPELSNAVAV
jgi:type I restriction enzyme S subunit